jgi:hypothetical protein
MPQPEGDKCPLGYTFRKGYTRKIRKSPFYVQRKGQLYTVDPKKNAAEIPASCVKNRASAVRNTQNALRKGVLIKYGYSYKLADGVREKALRKAVEAYGAKKVYSKLHVVAKLAQKKYPQPASIFARDSQWVKAHFKF